MITGNDNTDSPTELRALGFSFQNPNGKIFKIPNNLSTIRRNGNKVNYYKSQTRWYFCF